MPQYVHGSTNTNGLSVQYFCHTLTIMVNTMISTGIVFSAGFPLQESQYKDPRKFLYRINNATLG